MNVSFLKPFAKAIVAFCAFGAVVGKAVADGTVDGVEFELIVSGLTGLGVYFIPNSER